MSEKLVTKGIVLRATATKEADYILNILTDTLGRIAVVARGARRKGSRIAALAGKQRMAVRGGQGIGNIPLPADPVAAVLRLAVNGVARNADAIGVILH